MDVFCLHEIYTKIYVFCVIYLLTSHRWTILYSPDLRIYVMIFSDDNRVKIKRREEILFLLFILYSPDLRIYVMIFSDDNKEERMNETGSIFSGNRLSL